MKLNDPRDFADDEILQCMSCGHVDGALRFSLYVVDAAGQRYGQCPNPSCQSVAWEPFDGVEEPEEDT